MRQFSEQELIRREKAKNLASMGIDPFGHSFDVTSNSKEVKDKYSERVQKNLKEWKFLLLLLDVL